MLQTVIYQLGMAGVVLLDRALMSQTPTPMPPPPPLPASELPPALVGACSAPDEVCTPQMLQTCMAAKGNTYLQAMPDNHRELRSARICDATCCAGDFVGIDSFTNTLGVYTAIGYQRFTVGGFASFPTAVFPAVNGCACLSSSAKAPQLTGWLFFKQR